MSRILVLNNRKPLLCRVALCLGLLCGMLPALAQIAPGKLSSAHTSLEGIANCTKCHVLGQEVADRKCLDCHTPIASRINAGTGYHSSPAVKNGKCRQCHSEHNGREFALVHWEGGRENFNHGSLTAFALEGAHSKAKCRDCHKAAFIRDPLVTGGSSVNTARTHLGLSRECDACHEDEHRDPLTSQCAKCHVSDSWTPATGFSHDKTAYPLTGKHQQLACAKCHPPQTAPVAATTLIRKKQNSGIFTRFSGLEFGNCTPCHRDAHGGKFGGNCTDCHVTSGFGQIAGNKFDHSLTKYPLTGKHRQVACVRCHTSGEMTNPVAHAACRDCHRDHHEGQFADRKDGGACESCHSTDGYLPANYGVAEHAASRYPLTGSHLAVPCISCHTTQASSNTARFDFTDTRCQSCHQDAHHGQLDLWISKSGCEFCHNADTWHRTSFDHKLARFPLEGKHREIVCLECHSVVNDSTGKEMVWIKPLSMACASCHEDTHGGQFLRTDPPEQTTDCRRCHTSSGWKQLVFEHNRDARFKLAGAHARAACGACHKRAVGADGIVRTVYKPLAVECASCHSSTTPRLP